MAVIKLLETPQYSHAPSCTSFLIDVTRGRLQFAILLNMYGEDWALNNLQLWMCHRT